MYLCDKKLKQVLCCELRTLEFEWTLCKMGFENKITASCYKFAKHSMLLLCIFLWVGKHECSWLLLLDFFFKLCIIASYLNSGWQLFPFLSAYIMSAYLLGRRSIYETVAFSAGLCGFVFMNTVPLTFLYASYHPSQRSSHSCKQGLSDGTSKLKQLKLCVAIVIIRRPPSFEQLRLNAVLRLDQMHGEIAPVLNLHLVFSCVKMGKGLVVGDGVVFVRL